MQCNVSKKSLGEWATNSHFSLIEEISDTNKLTETQRLQNTKKKSTI